MDTNYSDTYPGHIRPVHEGVYERIHHYGQKWYGKRPSHRFSYWDGERWGLSSLTVSLACSQRSMASSFSEEHFSWRGLASKDDK